MFIVSLSFSLSFKEGNIFGKMEWTKERWKETCCHRHCLHESAKIQNVHPEVWTMTRQKEHPIQVVVIGYKTVCNNQKNEIYQDQSVSILWHTFRCVSWGSNNSWFRPTTWPLVAMDRLYASAHRFRYSTLALPLMINQRVGIDITFCARHRHES